MPKKKAGLSFEEAIAKLEEAAELLRSQELSLEESVELYNQSIVYYNRCREILNKAKQKIEMYKPETGEVIEIDK
jgi:exodeoxyribonuclease VII small subunit